MAERDADAAPATGWLNRTVIGAGLASLLADACYEMAAPLLPAFLSALQLPAFAFAGIIEGVADAAANFAKLGAGWYSDRVGRRKPFVVFGYALTGTTQALFALASGFPLIFAAKVLGWLGKGIRSPLRNAILADAVSPDDHGKAFGLHRASDTVGAVIGPLAAFLLLRAFPPTNATDTGTYRWIFAFTLIPGLASAAAFALLVRERHLTPDPARGFRSSVRELPRPFWRWLAGVGVFGAGDFSDKLLILAAIILLAPAYGAAAIAMGPLLYAWRNVVQAAASFPIGWLSDKVGARRPLIGGYVLGAATMALFGITTFHDLAYPGLLFGLFALAGIYLAAEEALESVVTADLVPERRMRGTAYGVIGMVNGVGDFVASLAAGLLMQYVSPTAAFIYAATAMLAGSVVLAKIR